MYRCSNILWFALTSTLFCCCKNETVSRKISQRQKIFFKENYLEKKIDSHVNPNGLKSSLMDSVDISFSSGWSDSVVLSINDSILFCGMISSIPSLSTANRGVAIVRNNESHKSVVLYIISRKEYVNFNINFLYRYIKISSYGGYILNATNSESLIY